MTTDAVLRFPDVRIGSTPASAHRLVKLVGLPIASRMVLLGEDLTAEEATEAGLAYRVVERDRLLEEATAVAQRLTALSPLSLRLAKQALGLAHTTDGETDLRVNLEAMMLCYDEPTQQQAIRDFLARRRD